MLKISDPHHFRKLVAGWCMVAAPALILVGAVIMPQLRSDETAHFGSIAANLDEFYAGQVFILAGVVLMFPAILGLMHMLRERETAYGHLGGGLALLGLVMLAGLTAIQFVVWQMAKGADTVAMVDLYARIKESVGIGVPFYAASWAFTLGVCLLAVGLIRARCVAPLMGLGIAAGAIVLTAGAANFATGWLIAGAAVTFAGFVSIGYTVLAETDEEWERTPQYTGFRPVAGIR